MTVRSLPIRALSLLMCCTAIAAAGPVDFGLSELNAAIAARKQRWKPRAELSLEPPETYRIEPYTKGGAHITGGDLRGLMYGLLEAAEQLRITGHLSPAHGTPSAPIREVRLVVQEGDTAQVWYSSEDFWRTYFQMLARNRFNRFTLVFTRPGNQLTAPYHSLQFLSAAAAEYGIELSLGIGADNVLVPDAHAGLRDLLIACRMIRSVQIGNTSQAPALFEGIKEAGRRVTVDVRGPLLMSASAHSEEVFKDAEADGLPILQPAVPWPPSFVVAPPRTGGRIEPEGNPLFYWAAGRYAYDPKTKPPKGSDADEFRAASDTVRALAMVEASAEGDAGDEWGFVASVPEAVHNAMEKVPSAKLKPVEIADLAEAAAARLGKSTIPDFQLLATLAGDRARQLRGDYQAEWIREKQPDASSSPAPGPQSADSAPANSAPPMAKALPRPQFIHNTIETAPANEPLTLTISIGQPKDVASVRLHYRPLHPLGALKTLEQPAAAIVNFTIPASDLPVNLDLLYYFEIFNREGGGWFEPDPLVETPFHILKIPAAPPNQ